MAKPQRYSHNYPIRVAWGEMDAFGHVNNVSYARYFESARADYFTVLGIWETPQKPLEAGPVLTHLEMDYRRQVVFPETLEVTVEVASFTSRGFRMATSMWNSNGDCVLTGHGDFIWMDFRTGRPVTIPQDLKNHFPHLF